MIELRGITRHYTTDGVVVEALRGIDLQLKPGTLAVVQGPSGSGKSTLLSILGVLDVPTAGEYRLQGRDPFALSDREQAHIRNQTMGFVFQRFNLVSHLSAWKNVALPLRYAGIRRKARKTLALQALDRVGLGERSDHLPSALSGGEEQRVAIARALIMQPALLLADEPTGNLDSETTSEILGLLRNAHADGMGIVLVTHDPLVASISDRTVHLRDGRVTPTASSPD